MQKMLSTAWTGSGSAAGRLKSSSHRVTERHQTRWSQRSGVPRADPRDTTTTTETAGAGVHAAAATKDTDHAALRTIAIAGDLRVPESLVDGCMEGEEAGAARTTDTGRGPGESPEGDLVLNPHPREKTSTRHRRPITPRKRCDGHTRRPTPGPGPHQDPALVRAPDPGLDASQEDARRVSAPSAVIASDGPGVGHLSRNDLFVLTWM